VENGLGSPLCGQASELTPEGRRNCATSGFEAAGAPTGDYALDVHIDTGLLGLSSQTLLQDYAIEPVWMGLVWVVHAVVVALEWCFTLDLLDSAAMGGVERALRRTQASFTGPWLALVLAVASIAAAYNGLVRRRVAETLGQAALTLAMMAGGMWAVADPAGTVGALGRWVDHASVGALGAVVDGSPAHASRTLAQSMTGLFADVVGAPWCYLEFGNVNWCESPARLEPRLRAAGLAIVTHTHVPHCPAEEGLESICQTLERIEPGRRAQGATVTLMRAARTNGELFLALPANAQERNSIDDSASLLSVLCGGAESATDCRGPTAREAEFRTQSGTTPRLAGLLLIAVGAAGMILLLGYIVAHLLGAEILSLLYLLLAPAAVLAPALGDGGRAAFRTWGTRLVGAVCSKLVFSFLLGVVLLLTRTLMGFQALGWWTRWLFVTILWWGAFRQRHQALGLVRGEHRTQHGQAQIGRRSTIARRVKEALETPTMAWRTAQRVRRRLAGPGGRASIPERRQTLARIGRERARAAADEQATRMLAHEHGDASARVASAADTHTELSAKRAQLQRVQAAQGVAAAAGDTRRATRLAVRGQRIEGEVAQAQQRLNAARHTAADGDRARRRTGEVCTREQAHERGRFLDAQAALPAGVNRRGGDAGQRRDYAALAGLAGYGREQYERLDPRRRREARLEIDRELALRRELNGAAGDVVAGAERPPQGREQRRADRDFDRALGQRLRDGGHRPPRSRTDRRAPLEQGPHDGRARAGGGRPPAGRASSVMRDAHEVARRRKRQLGGDG
jgi:hypothetical protein